jgi:hypothetical protein
MKVEVLPVEGSSDGDYEPCIIDTTPGIMESIEEKGSTTVILCRVKTKAGEIRACILFHGTEEECDAWVKRSHDCEFDEEFVEEILDLVIAKTANFRMEGDEHGDN